MAHSLSGTIVPQVVWSNGGTRAVDQWINGVPVLSNTRLFDLSSTFVMLISEVNLEASNNATCFRG